VRALLVAVLALGLTAALAASGRAGLALASLALLAAFLLGAGKLAADVIELRRSDLAADGLVVAASGAALLRWGGSRDLLTALLAVALAAQLAAALARRRAPAG
jgi:hypothetical protein